MGWIIAGGLALPARGVAVLLAIIPAAPVTAQAGADIEAEPTEIIVTARKRAERLLDVPVTVSVFDRAAIEAERIDSVADLIQRVPGATFTNVGPAFTNEIMIRGFGSGRGINAETTVGFYRNGFYSAGNSRSLARIDFFDVARVEVLRGPQGGLFGRNAAGGAINVVSAEPGDVTEGSALLVVDDNSRVEGEAVFNLAASDRIGVRFGLIGIRQTGGDFRNADGAILDRETLVGGRATVVLRPWDGLTATVSTEHFDEDGPSFGVFAYNQLAPPSERFRRRMNTPSRIAREENFTTLRVEADLGPVTLTSGTMRRWRRASFDDDLDSMNAVVAPLLVNWRRQSFDGFRRLGQELRLASRTEGPLSWQAGAELLTLDSYFDVLITGAAGAAQAQNSRSRTDSDDRAIAVYGTMDLNLTPRLVLAGELRSTWDRKRIAIQATTYSPAGMRTDRSFAFDRTFAKVSPVATLTWTPTAEASLYVRYATGFRAGGFNNEPDPLAPERFTIAYQPESTTAFEAGGRLQAWDRRLRAAAAFYRMETDGLLAPVSYPVSAGGAFRNVVALQNVGRSRQSGVEVELDAALVRDARGGRLDGRLAVSHGWGRITEGPFAGQPVPRLRDWTVAAGGHLRQPLTAGLALTAGVSFRGEFGGRSATVPLPAPDIHILDLQLGLEGKGWSVVGAVDNVADDLFDGDRNIRDAASGLFRQVYTTRPRRFSLRGRVQF